MIAAVSRLMDRIRGTGSHSVTTPPMDGALQPNQAIEAADLVASLATPDNLVRIGADVLVSSGRSILRLAAPRTPVETFDAPVSTLAAAPDGTLAVGLESGRIVIRGAPHDGTILDTAGGRPLVCPTALAFEYAGTLLVCLGSRKNPPGRWRHDLMQREASGSVWRIRLGGSAECLADGLAYPYGILPRGNGQVVVSEAWRRRLVAIGAGSRPLTVLDDLPGYPSRLVARRDGGAWLAVFAPCSQLIEFVLRERDYCEAMMRDIPEAYWIAPSLAAPRSFLEPMQGGALKQLGMLKPWAPTRSIGLVVALDERFRPAASWHSRADGTRHGVTSCIEDAAGDLLIASKGGDAVLRLDVDGEAGT